MQYAGFDDIALHCMQYARYAKKYARYAKYANVAFNMQNMHCPLCWWEPLVLRPSYHDHQPGSARRCFAGAAKAPAQQRGLKAGAWASEIRVTVIRGGQLTFATNTFVESRASLSSSAGPGSTRDQCIVQVNPHLCGTFRDWIWFIARRVPAADYILSLCDVSLPSCASRRAAPTSGILTTWTTRYNSVWNAHTAIS